MIYIFYKIARKLKNKISKLIVDLSNRKLREDIINHGGKLGRNFVSGKDVMISGLDKVEIGDNVSIGSGSYLKAEGGLMIGNNVVISRNLTLYTSSHEYNGKRLPFDNTFRYRNVKIHDNVWIGMNVTISPGTEIGEGAIIGLGANVFGYIEPYSIIAGKGYSNLGKRDIVLYQQLVSKNSFGDKDGNCVTES